MSTSTLVIQFIEGIYLIISNIERFTRSKMLKRKCNMSSRKKRFCWGISNFAGYRSENNFVRPSK